MKQKELLVISVSIFLTLIAWMVIEIYAIQTKDEVSKIIAPLKQPKVTIDQKVLQDLKQKTP